MTLFQSLTTASETATTLGEPIAIISLSGRYPGGANSPDQLWELLKSGRDGVTQIEGDRWDASWHHPKKGRKGRVYAQAGGFLDDVRGFDADFFGISPREAEQIDPQQRLLLELTWELLENAGVLPAQVSGQSVGVYVGISNNDYAQLVGGGAPNAYSNTGSAFSIAANRISYIFDLAGPSMAVDTACSSSLVCVHQACQAISGGECEMAIAGGVNILADIRPWQGFAAASMLSPEGRCKSFDASGSGYVRAEGGGLILLKPLSLAERDGDQILGVIRATGVNSDGRTMGMSMPSADAQAALLERLYTANGISADDVFYVEAHGTGTSVGDPIECEALGRVLGQSRNGASVCHIGSVKSNIGHLEPASGIAGLSKILLGFQHGEIPANLHFTTPNPKIDFEGWKLNVVDRPLPLPGPERPICVGINSFGFGGTNSHAIIERYCGKTKIDTPLRTPGLLLLSAQSDAALRSLAQSYLDLLRAPGADWAAIASGTAHFRAPLSRRLVVRAESAAQAAERLQAWLSEEHDTHTATGSAAREVVPVAFAFSGNGPQWWGMGRELLAENSEFRAHIEAIDRTFAPLAGWSLLEEMARPEAESRIELTEVAQPMLFALQVGLTELLRAQGIQPAVVFGHSVGEAAAAWASGALSLEAATQVIYHRSREQARTAGLGKMAALGIDAETAQGFIDDIGGWLEIAAFNAPEGVTVAGDEVQLSALVDRVVGAGKFARLLTLDYPFHTKAMDMCREGLMQALEGIEPRATDVPFISSVTGTALEGQALDADYWFHNVREPVQFEDAALHALQDHDVALVLEIGPHPVLRDYVMQIARAHSEQVTALQTLRRPGKSGPESDVDNLSQAMASAFAHGAALPAALCDKPRIRPNLPNYPWQRSEHWRGAVAVPDTFAPVKRAHPLLGGQIASASGLWEGALNTAAISYLPDHRVQDSTVFPAAGYIEQALAAGRSLFGEDSALTVESCAIHRPLALDSDVDMQSLVQIDPQDGRCEIRSRISVDAADSTLHFTSRVSQLTSGTDHRIDLDALRQRLPALVASEDFYADAAKRGLHYGPAFNGVRSIALSAPDADLREALTEVSIDLTPFGGNQGYLSHPALLDSGLQGAIALVAQGDARRISTLPISIETLHVFAQLPERLFCHITLKRESSRTVLFDMLFCDTDGHVLIDMRNARCQKANLVDPGASPILVDDWRHDDSQPLLHSLPALPDNDLLFAELSLADAPSARKAAFSQATHRLMGLYAAAALDQLRPQAETFDQQSLIRHARIRRQQTDYLAQVIALAEHVGAVVPEGRGWRWQGIDTPGAAPQLWAELYLSYPECQAELVLLAEAGAAVQARLTAKDAITLNPTALAQLFDTAPYAEQRNAALQAVFAQSVAHWPQHRPLRVLEIGAWTGALTTTLLPLLPKRASWHVTDPREEDVARLTRRFEDAAQITVSALTAGDSFDTLGMDRGSIDIVLVSRADRLGKNLDAMLVEIRKVLADGGILVLAGMPDPAFEGFVLNETTTLTASDLAAAGLVETQMLRDGLLIARAHKQIAPGQPGKVECQTIKLIGAADDGLVSETARALKAAGHQVSHVVLSDEAKLPEVPGTELSAQAPDGIVLISAEKDAPEAQDTACLSLLETVRNLNAETTTTDTQPWLRVVTRGAFPSGFGDAPLYPSGGAVWGLGRVVANEVPTAQIKLIDWHDAAGNATELMHEILMQDAEIEVQISHGQRFVNRTRIASAAQLSESAGQDAAAFVLDFLPQGGFDSLHLRATERKAPGAHDVEIAVRSAGLNFRDVLWCMGMLPEEAVEHGFSGATIGMECAGEIVRVGDGVTEFAVGDKVVAFASSCMGSHVTTDAGSVAKMPEGMDFEAAATIPTTFLTAWYAFDYLARLEPGETVLIHGAAGGVGLAAVQIAKLKGAKIIGTAGSPLKRRVLELLGVDHVLNSRTLDFAEEVMQITDGKGVDVILNSLAGEAILRNLNCLKPFGRFLEIGKRDFYANSRIGLRPFRNNLSYFGIDADTLLVERPDLGRRMFAQVLEQFRAGHLHPLPHQRVPISRASEAFRLMQQSRHIGKIVISTEMDRRDALRIVPARSTLRGDGTYLVTGGLAGFGLETARWLVAQGVRNLALVSRSGAATPGALQTLADFAAQGVNARAFACDIADHDALAKMLDELRRDMTPLTGIIHAAAVIEDAPLANITPEQMQRVFRPKITGAWNLHQLTLHDPVETFIMYSSASALIGNPGQGVYVAANHYLDSLAMYRKSQGLPALAVGWGAIQDAGFLTRNEAVIGMLKSRSGMDATPADLALADLGGLLATGTPRAALARFDMATLHKMMPAARSPRFTPMIPADLLDALANDETLADRVRAMPKSERMPYIQQHLRESIARILGTTAAQIETEKPISDLGLDSLMAVELATAIEREIGSAVPVMQLLGAGSLRQVAAMIGQLIGVEGSET